MPGLLPMPRTTHAAWVPSHLHPVTSPYPEVLITGVQTSNFSFKLPSQCNALAPGTSVPCLGLASLRSASPTTESQNGRGHLVQHHYSGRATDSSLPGIVSRWHLNICKEGDNTKLLVLPLSNLISQVPFLQVLCFLHNLSVFTP